MAWFGLVWFGLVWFGLVWFGLVWFGLVWFGLVWFGLVWFGLVWFGLVWFGLVWFGLVWFGLVWFGLVARACRNRCSAAGVSQIRSTTNTIGRIVKHSEWNGCNASSSVNTYLKSQQRRIECNRWSLSYLRGMKVSIDIFSSN